ncbi:hypothetical protein L1887_11599 [Cichorium endivia]|nr:hypothetical protein L1887_11599 [Cichorium endivia]
MERRARVASSGDDWNEVCQRNKRETRDQINTRLLRRQRQSTSVTSHVTGWKPIYGDFSKALVTNLQDLVNSLNGAWCGNSRLRANLAKYERKNVPLPPKFFANNMPQVTRDENYGNSERRTYAEVVGNRKPSSEAPLNRHTPSSSSSLALPPHPHPTPNQEPKELRFLTSDMSKRVAFKEVEGNSSFELRCVGGLNTLLEFEDETEMKSFLENGEHIWKPWFKTFVPWNQDMQLNKRITSLLIYGIPLHAWCEEAFSTFASTWGWS